MNVTQKHVRAVLKAAGMAIYRIDDEYRVNFRRAPESTAYYTNDLEDALETGLYMARTERSAWANQLLSQRLSMALQKHA